MLNLNLLKYWVSDRIKIFVILVNVKSPHSDLFVSRSSVPAEHLTSLSFRPLRLAYSYKALCVIWILLREIKTEGASESTCVSR